jgi:hypothetical protein
MRMSEKMCIHKFKSWLTLRLIDVRSRYPQEKPLLDLIILNAVSMDKDDVARVLLMLEIASSRVGELSSVLKEASEKYSSVMLESLDEVEVGDYEPC